MLPTAQLAAVQDDELGKAFAEKFKGRIIASDGNIALVANHGDHETRYEMLIAAGDYRERTQVADRDPELYATA